MESYRSKAEFERSLSEEKEDQQSLAATGRGKQKEKLQDLSKLIDELTIDEKSMLVSGADQWRTLAIPRLGIPSVMVADGPHGLRKENKAGGIGVGAGAAATCFPTAATISNSWNPGLVREIARAIGREALQEGVSVVLGPGVNIKRSPLCGRNFEYFSEDPWLSGSLAAAWIQGMQSVGVGACPKHFAANNQETWRMLNDSLVDQRALREIYLAGFEKAVRLGQPWAIMAAYNKLNGIYCCEHGELLDQILRREWGFQGAVISDWGGVNDPVLSLRAGLDLEMPSSYGEGAGQIRSDLQTGRLTEAVLNRSVRRILELVTKGQAHARADYEYDQKAHHFLAKKAAEESAVLLKNENGLLPLRKGQSIAVLGQFAQYPRYQGSGSSQITPTRLDTVFDQLQARQEKFYYARGYLLEERETNQALVEEACRAAEKADAAVVFAGLTRQDESEGYDRTHLELPPAHNELIRQVAKVNKNTIVVLSGGAPVTLPWLDQVGAVLHTYLGGQAGAGAAVDILLGQVNPSGKLAESYPLRLEDVPAGEFFANDRDQTEYRESIFVGYRYYDRAEKKVLFPFGHGLSYTEFKYSDLKISPEKMGKDHAFKVSCTVCNVGARSGAEIVQLYVGKKESNLFRAVKELKGFAKTRLEPAEAKTVEFTLESRSFAYYNAEIGDWHVEKGEYHILVGPSSRDLPLRGSIHLESSLPQVEAPDLRGDAPSYYSLGSGGMQIPAQEFEAVYGRAFPERKTDKYFHLNSTLSDLKATRSGRLVATVIERKLRKLMNVQDEQDPLWRLIWTTIMETPLRSFGSLTDGRVSTRFIEGLLNWVNGEHLQAVKHWTDL